MVDAARQATAAATAPDAAVPVALLIERVQIDTHFRPVPMMLLIHAIIPSIYFYATYGAVEPHSIIAWQSTMLALVGARLVLGVQYARVRPVPARAAIWGRWSTAGSLLTGVLWGGLSLVLWPSGLESQVLLAATLAGIAATAVASLTVFYPPATVGMADAR